MTIKGDVVGIQFDNKDKIPSFNMKQITIDLKTLKNACTADLNVDSRCNMQGGLGHSGRLSTLPFFKNL